MRERLRRILCLILSLTAAAGLMLVRDSAAWFNTQTGSPLGQNITVEKLKFTFTGSIGSFLQYDSADENSFFIITDQNLVQGNNGAVELSGTNASTFPTQVRYKVSYTSPQTGTKTDYTGSSDLLNVTYNSTVWTFDATDHYFYYGGKTGIMASSVTDFVLLTGLSFSEDALTQAGVTATSSLRSGSITVDIQAKQADNMIWEDIGSIGS